MNGINYYLLILILQFIVSKARTSTALELLCKMMGFVTSIKKGFCVKLESLNLTSSWQQCLLLRKKKSGTGLLIHALNEGKNHNLQSQWSYKVIRPPTLNLNSQFFRDHHLRHRLIHRQT